MIRMAPEVHYFGGRSKGKMAALIKSIEHRLPMCREVKVYTANKIKILQLLKDYFPGYTVYSTSPNIVRILKKVDLNG